MKQLSEKFKLIRWLWSDQYETALGKVLHPGFKDDLLGVCDIARKNFPFLNTGYFGNYEAVKQDSRELWGVDVQEVELPSDLLGAYVPKGKDGKSVILINKTRSPLFKLTTLSHELSHVPVYQYLQKKHEHACDEIRVRNRIAVFANALIDPEEVLPDVLTTLGAYPQPDFKRIFAKTKFGIWAMIKAMVHLPRHYPELIAGFLRGKDILLNLALAIHFLKLRYFLYERFEI